MFAAARLLITRLLALLLPLVLVAMSLLPVAARAQWVDLSTSPPSPTMQLGVPFSQSYWVQSYVEAGISGNFSLGGNPPPGLDINPKTGAFFGTLAGTPTATGTYAYSVTFTAIPSSGPPTPVTANFTVTVTAVPPTTTPVTVQVSENSSNNVLTPTTANATSVTLASASNGTATPNGLNIIYAPTAGFVGNDAISYRVVGPGGTANGVINVTVVAPTTPAAPTTSPTTAQVPENSANNILTPTTANATSVILASASNGTASPSGLNVIYTPKAGFAGNDVISYRVVGPGGSANGTITVTVLAAPTTQPMSVQVQVNSVGNVLTPMVAGTTSLGTSTASHGTASASGLSIIYTPTAGYIGNDVINYTAVGPGGGVTGTINVTVVTSLTTQGMSIQVPVNSVGNLISPPTAGATALTLTTPPANGSVTANGMSFRYTPNANFIGSDAIGYLATGPGGSVKGTITIAVVAGAPSVSGATLYVNYGKSGSIDLAPFVSGQALMGVTLAVSTPAKHGQATIAGTVLTYTPGTGYSGPDDVYYTAASAAGKSSPAHVAIVVGTPSDPSLNPGVKAIREATQATMRHFQAVQIGNIDGHLNALASSSIDHPELEVGDCARRSLWVSGLGSRGSLGGGIDFDASGITVGADRCLGASSTIGIGVGFGHERGTTSPDGSHTTGNSETTASYGSMRLLPSWRVNWMVGATRVRMDYDRTTDDVAAMAHGQWSSTSWMSSISTHYDLHLRDFRFAPYGRVDTSTAQIGAYAESGPASYTLRYLPQHAKTSHVAMGFNGDYTYERDFGRIKPVLRMEYQRDFSHREATTLGYADAPQGQDYTLPADDQERRMLSVMLGADVYLRSGLSFGIHFASMRSNGSGHANSLRIGATSRF